MVLTILSLGCAGVTQRGPGPDGDSARAPARPQPPDRTEAAPAAAPAQPPQEPHPADDSLRAAFRPPPAGDPAGRAAVAPPQQQAAARPSSTLAAASARRVPLMPWPFFGVRSLVRLGPRGIAGLRPASPEHRLLVQLDRRECGDRGPHPTGSCFFLEKGRVYEIRRADESEPPRFELVPVPLGAEWRIDSSKPERPVLVSITPEAS